MNALRGNLVQSGPSSTPARILVVDDVEASRYITSSWLRRGGHIVTEATTGGEALEIVGEHATDLVVLDVHLPDMSGFEVCERIKGDPSTSALPVIHVSATSIDPEDRTQGLSRGADAYLSEPVDPGELLATVEAALRYYRARTTAERLARRLTHLTRATLAINAASNFDELVSAAASGAATILDSAATALVVLPKGPLRIGTLTGPGQPITSRTERTSVIERLTTTVLGDGEGSGIAQVDDPGWPADEPVTVVLARTKAARPPICIAVPSAAASTDEDRNLLMQWGQAAALAVEGLRAFTEEHNLAIALQNSLLPTSLPDHPELPIAVRYVPASANAEIGGDFYEVTELDGRLLIAVGDVVGHSLEAAIIMGEVRHALRAYAVEGHGLVQILDRLDAMLQRFHPRGFTTLCLLLVDLASSTVSVANAGHLPPLIADEDGARYLAVRGPLLGVGLRRPEPTQFAFPAGTLVLMVTDGLVERPGQSLDDGLDKLRTSVSHSQDLNELCDELLAKFGEDQGDDIAMLAMRRL
jgi:serine phosphatase RsbU (regulator of sigma subunit)/CheY-like chemotaxis protein